MGDIPAGDYEKGKKIFKQRCLQCHVVDSLATKTGPTLNGLIGRKSGSVPGFPYSDANKSKVYFASVELLFLNLPYKDDRSYSGKVFDKLQILRGID